MSIRDDDHGDVDRIQLTPSGNGGRTCDSGNVGSDEWRRTEFSGEEFSENPLVVGCSSTLESQGELPKCMYHLMSPTVPAKTPVDPRFSSEKPPRVRMILPELNRGTIINYCIVYCVSCCNVYINSCKII